MSDTIPSPDEVVGYLERNRLNNDLANLRALVEQLHARIDSLAGELFDARNHLVDKDRLLAQAEAREAKLRSELKRYLGTPEEIETEKAYLNRALFQAEARQVESYSKGWAAGAWKSEQKLDTANAALSTARAEANVMREVLGR